MSTWWYKFLIAGSCMMIVKGCSLAEPPKEFTMGDTLILAPIVVSGTDVKHQADMDTPSNYTFRVSCVFKSNGLDLPRNIFLIDVGATTCDGTEMEPAGKSYIVGLERITGDEVTRGEDVEYFGKDSDIPYYFRVFEPDVGRTGAFEASIGNLRNTSRLCGLDDTIKSLGEGFVGDHLCPVRNVTSETCVSASPPFIFPISSLLIAAWTLIVVLYV